MTLLLGTIRARRAGDHAPSSISIFSSAAASALDRPFAHPTLALVHVTAPTSLPTLPLAPLRISVLTNLFHRCLDNTPCSSGVSYCSLARSGRVRARRPPLTPARRGHEFWYLLALRPSTVHPRLPGPPSPSSACGTWAPDGPRGRLKLN
ncbi:hypothetical protein C8F04DRAFT_49202 [Mycena alexandri]|uniref:Uncharacterized protein n=1 Tax=Mycena alexandri TaxID=1745969 RepID=A0AAD6SM57_9AGAR|nr:hypothetical protein C8F04DRAFT_49202 [Mycena alexandri]